MKAPELDVMPFATAKAFGTWLKKNHARSPGIWLRFYKKDSGIKTITYAEALDEALCYGWIDSQKKTYDAKSYVIRCTPRGTKSVWSKVNIGHIARLTKAGRMQPSGIAKVEAAKKDGRWAKAYDSQKDMKVPDDLLKELKKHKKAETFFHTLSKANIYAIAWRLHTAVKPETRARRMKTILDMLEKGQKFY